MVCDPERLDDKGFVVGEIKKKTFFFFCRGSATITRRRESHDDERDVDIGSGAVPKDSVTDSIFF